MSSIDTARLICKARPTGQQLKEHWQRRESTKPGVGTTREYFYNPPRGEEVQIRATYRPENRMPRRRNGRSKKALEQERAALEDQFVIEFSLPKLVFGNNCEMIRDLRAAIELADEKLAQVPAFPVLPSLQEWTVSRVDVCYNYFVGPLVSDYVTALSVLEYPRRDTVRVNAETVEYRAQSVKTKFYDKLAEARLPEAEGLLRHETTFHRAAAIKAAIHRQGTLYLSDITPEHCRAILEADLSRLGILGLSLGNFNTALAALTAEYGPARATRLFGIIALFQQYTRAEIAVKLGQTRNFVNRCLLDIRKAGVSLTLPQSDYPLPPLEVDL